MANSYVVHTGDGSAGPWSVPFGYIDPNHVLATVDGVPATFTWPTSSTVTFDVAPGVGTVIKIYRETSPTAVLVDFAPGYLSESDLDTAYLHTFYLAQEAVDNVEDSMKLGSTLQWDAESTEIINVANGVNPQDAVTKAQLDAAVMAAGNVVAPLNPADDGKVLAASGGAWSWTSFVISMISDATAWGKSWLGLADAAAARTALSLGDVALKTGGVGNGNVPVMDTIGYPAADGSQITNVDLPRGYIDGLTLSNDATDPAKDIGIAAGAARDGSNAANLVLSSALIKKLDASWAVGTNQGALDGTESVAGTPDASTWYHIWLIRRSDTGVVDILASESATAPTMPTNYDQKRRIGAVLTDATPNIIGFSQDGDEFLWDDPPLDVDGTLTGTTSALFTLSVPPGFRIQAKFNAVGQPSSGTASAYISSPDQNDEAVSLTAAPLGNLRIQTSGSAEYSRFDNIRTDTSARIRAVANASFSIFRIATLGWIDPRGRNA